MVSLDPFVLTISQKGGYFIPEPFNRPNTPSNNVLIYGASGSGKSTRLGEAAAYVHQKWGLKTRIIGADGGGTTNAVGPLIDEGIIQYWAIDQWDAKGIFHNIDLATKGWWPQDPGIPNSPLQNCVEEWRPCPACKGDSGCGGLTMRPDCAACGAKFPAGTLLPVSKRAVKGLEEVGLVCFEGFTVFGDMMLDRLAELNPDGGRFIIDGEIKIAASGKQHYGDAQKRIMKAVANCRLIPVPFVIWTALEVRADDDGHPLYGPKGPGKALTAVCQRAFTDVLHLDALPKMEGARRVKDANGFEILERKLFSAPHYPPDAPNMQFKCKTSAPMGGGMVEVLSPPDMRQYFQLLEEARARAKKHFLQS